MALPPRTVLLVDDSAIIRGNLCQLFEWAGFQVCAEAENGSEAIEQAARYKPDLIILDLSMPVMDGLQATPVLRRMLPATPIILFSMYADSILTKGALAAGISAVVPKSDASMLIGEAEAHLKIGKSAAGSLKFTMGRRLNG